MFHHAFHIFIIAAVVAGCSGVSLAAEASPTDVERGHIMRTSVTVNNAGKTINVPASASAATETSKAAQRMRTVAASPSRSAPRMRNLVSATVSVTGGVALDDWPLQLAPTDGERGHFMRTLAESNSVTANNDSKSSVPSRNVSSLLVYAFFVMVGFLMAVMGWCVYASLIPSRFAASAPDSACSNGRVPLDAADSDDGSGSDLDEVHTSRSAAPMYEQALEVPENEQQLIGLLNDAGIDTSKWDGHSVESLRGQLLRGECWLTYSGKSGESQMLVRRVRVLNVKIAALFPGLRVLRCTGVTDHVTGEFKAKKQECAKKLEIQDDIDEVVPGLLLHELHLPLEWQKEHLSTFQKYKSFTSSGAERGKSFPGLMSQYFAETVCMKLEDRFADGIAGCLNLPSGTGTFDIVDESGVYTSKTRRWEWTPAIEDEVDMSWRSASKAAQRVVKGITVERQ